MASTIAPRQPAAATPRIDFYFDVDHRLQYACRVTRKARAAGLTVLAFTRNADRLARFDAALWTFSALDFIAHVHVDSPLAAATPVLLAHDVAAAPARDLLLTLDDDVAPSFVDWLGRFDRVIEVVSREDDDRALARLRFKAYRDAGFAPSAHPAAAP